MKAPATLVEAASEAETVDSRIIATMRLVLAVSALLIVLVAPSEPDRLVVPTYAALSFYAVYSAALYVLALRNSPRGSAIDRWAHWIDVAWYVVLIALSQGTSSIFFFGFFFAIQVASFRWGFIEGLRVTLISAILFAVVGYLARPAGEDFELNRFLIRPVYLLAIGYMMAYWGGFEIAYKRRLALLNEVSALSNPRFGIDHAVGSFMQRLRAFYAADACLLVQGDRETDTYHLRRVDRSEPEAGARAESIPAGLGRMLLALPDGCAMAYDGRRRLEDWWRQGTRYRAYEIKTGKITSAGYDESRAVAATLDVEAFISVPMLLPTESSNRLYLTTRGHRFDNANVDFLLQVIQHITPALENIRLVDRLAWHAAEEERQRIARDLHDSIVQPYIGLQMGLAALQHKAGVEASDDLRRSINSLVRYAEEGIADLRGYVRGLKSGSESDGDLLAALRRYTARFAEATNIDVQLESTGSAILNGRLAAEVFQMVAEGLSNVRRHTQATRAAVHLAQRNGRLILRVENEHPEGAPLPSFTPRSITERAKALGGSARVEQHGGSTTSVVIEIPL
jgi:signal transduction histidine kinase